MLARRALSTRLADRGLVIAGADSGLRRRLLKSFAAAHQPRKVVDIGSRPGFERKVAALVPSVVLFDLGPKPDARTFAIVSALSSLAKTIVIADTEAESLAIPALKAGASGFCRRDTPPALIRKAIQLVEAGEIWIGRRVMLGLIEEMARLRHGSGEPAANSDALTEREHAIANLVARGAGNKDIAHALSISVKTVKAHLTNIFQRIGVSDRTQAALWAQRQRLR
jgi:DNA-binding NarL/FixJ family response regulator